MDSTVASPLSRLLAIIPMEMVPAILALVEERLRQDEKFGRDSTSRLPHGTSAATWKNLCDSVRSTNDWQMASGTATCQGILWEEVLEAFSEESLPHLYMELKQLAAFAVAWMQKIERENPGLINPVPQPLTPLDGQ